MSLWGLSELERRLANLIRFGVIDELNEGTARVRVRAGNVTTAWLPWITWRAGPDRMWSAPEPGEQVIVLAPSGELSQAVVIAGLFQDSYPAPASSKTITKFEIADGTTITYDRETHKLTIDIPEDGGEVVINAATKVTVNSPAIDLGESGSLEPSVLGDKLAAWITDELKVYLDTHQHIGNLGAPTSPAMAGPVGPFVEGTGATGGDVYSQKNRNQ